MLRIKYLVMDVDGTLTDGKIYVGNSGEMMKSFDVKDGLGITMLAIPNGIEPVVITGRSSEIVKVRCEELGIYRLYQGIKDKDKELRKICMDLSTVAYIGDDLNDLAVMKDVKNSGGVVGCPIDATREVRNMADFVSEKTGGNGAVRQFLEWILGREK